MDKALEKPTLEGPLKSLKEQTEVFDIIHSKELERLFQKNARLLTRISTTQQRNTLLQKELFSLIEEKSQLGVKNTLLSDEISTLREKVSSFKDKQKLFSEQSSRLQNILSRLKFIQEQKKGKEGGFPIRQEGAVAENKLARYILFRKKVKTAHRNLKARLNQKIRRIQVLEDSQNQLKEQLISLRQKKPEKTFHQTPDIRELETLQNSFNDLQRALSQQQEGFASALRACRKKHLRAMKSAVEGKERELTDQAEKRKQLEKNLQTLKEALQKKERNIQDLTELKDEKSIRLKKEEEKQKRLHKQTEEKIEGIVSEYQTQLREMEQQYEEELTRLNAELKKLSDQKKTNRLREQEVLKTEYEHRIKNLTEAHERKLKNICTEMENDLCSEKRKTEILQSERAEEIKQMERNIQTLSQDVRRLTVKNHALEKSNGEFTERIKKEIAANSALKYQSKQARELWQNLQEQLEKRNQQVESLQKLNRNLSLQLNERNPSYSPAPLDPTGKSSEERARPAAEEELSPVMEEGTESSRHPLADIHFS